jgi:hypothetical protein
MNANERRACEGLLPDEDTSIVSDMAWLREHVERLAWELESTGHALTEATEKLRSMGGSKP